MLTQFHPELVPAWAFKAMLLECKYCGAPIEQNENLTARWCPNRKCPGHMAYKMVDLAKFFGIKGIGPATAVNLIRDYHFESHFDIMKFWFPDKKPMYRLSDIVALAAIDGYGNTQAERDLAAYYSFEDYFAHSNYIHPLLRKNKELLLHAETFFTVTPPLASEYINVMGTGSFNGYSSRDEYFRMVNHLFGDRLHIIECGKRKTNVAFLIKEHNAVDHSKSVIAAECGIPVVTPLEFIQILCAHFHMSIEDIKKKGELLE